MRPSEASSWRRGGSPAPSLFLGRSGVPAVVLPGLVLVTYVAECRQVPIASDLATANADTVLAMTALTEERRQVNAAASIAAADTRRAIEVEGAAEASTNRLRELEAWLSANADVPATLLGEQLPSASAKADVALAIRAAGVLRKGGHHGR